LASYTPQAVLPAFEASKDDWAITQDATETGAILQAIAQPAHPLTDNEATAILAFLESLTDPAAIAGRLGIPATVPSGLPIDR
jgi:cytochrome c peroxidase